MNEKQDDKPVSIFRKLALIHAEETAEEQPSLELCTGHARTGDGPMPEADKFHAGNCRFSPPPTGIQSIEILKNGQKHSTKEHRMKGNKLTLENQLKGVTKAIESPNTPPQLKKALVRRAAELRKQLRQKASRGIVARLGFLQMDWRDSKRTMDK
jgi:hypothetical protein